MAEVVFDAYTDLSPEDRKIAGSYVYDDQQQSGRYKVPANASQAVKDWIQSYDELDDEEKLDVSSGISQFGGRRRSVKKSRKSMKKAGRRKTRRTRK